MKTSTLNQELIDEIKSMQRPGKPDVFLEIVQVFLETALQASRNLKAAVAGGDFFEINDAAHALKSSAAYVGALRLSDICRSFELLSEKRDSTQLSKLAADFDAEFAAVTAELKELLTSSPSS